MKKMNAALISQGSKSSLWTLEAMRKYFDEVDDIRLTEIEINLGSKNDPILISGKPMGRYDCIYVKGSFRYSPLLRAITALSKDVKYKPIEANTFTIAHDKLLTQQKMQESGIPMPITYIASTIEAAKEILENINYPIVLKFPQGTQGKGVMFAESFASANSMLDALTALKQPVIIQEYIETGGSDVRAIVVGNTIVASMKRRALEGEKRSNVHAGGKGEACSLDSYTKKIAIDAANALNADICGVDILESASGPKVIEVNISPGLQGITAATKIDVADKIAKFLFSRTKEIVEKDKEQDTKKLLEKEGIKAMDGKKEIISVLDFRGSRILLPDIISEITKFNDKEEHILSAEKGKLTIRKFS